MANMTQETINKVKELNQQYKAGEITEDQVRAGVADEYYKRQPEKLQNADVNLTQYGDDSSPENYNNPDLWGGMNDKYTGENTKNSQVAYDPNATVEGLDPNYQYGRNAQMANSDSANYIATRNDQIASALYNAGKTSIEDVRNFLEGQRGFFNSDPNERENTINSVWKRLGQIASENGNNNEQEQSNTNNDQALENMQNDLMKDTTGQLYGKVTADEGNPENGITTQADPYNVDKMMAEARIANVKKLQTMDSQSIAASIIAGTTPYGEQAMRDLMQYNPEKYQEIQTAVKQLKGQDAINSITKGEEINTYTNGEVNVQNDITDFAESYSDVSSVSETLKNVSETLKSNDKASTAQEQMADIEQDMATLQNRLKNLDKEANSVFKGDVPQYIVNAYKANRTAEIQDQLQILENRYNAAYNRYQTEWEQTKRQAEYALKVQQLQLKQEQSAINNWATKQGIMIDWAKVNGTTGTIDYTTAMQTFEEFSNTYTDGMYLGETNGQCGAFVKNYLSRIGISLPNVSSLESKVALINTDEGYQPVEGDIVIMNSPNKPSNGHMAIVSSVDDDGTIHLLEANWNSDYKVHTTRTVKPGDASILGYYSPYKQNTQLNENDSKWRRNDGTSFDLNSSSTYQTLDSKSKEAVKQLLNNSLAKSSVTKRTGYEDPEGIFAAVSEINPLWSETDYNNRKTAEANWTKLEIGGAISRNATAASTAKRIYDLVDSITDADLQRTEYKTLNALINATSKEFGNPKIVQLQTLLEGLQSEAAGALKGGNAAISDQDKRAMENILNANLTTDQLKTAMGSMVRLLYDKNETEARAISEYSFLKKKPIWTEEVQQWMNDELGIDLSVYYNYGTQLSDIPPEDTDWLSQYLQ